MVKSWSFKEKFRSLRPSLTDPNPRKAELTASDEIRHRQLAFGKCRSSRTEVWRALSPAELPEKANFPLTHTLKLSQEIFAAGTGPNSGLRALQNWPVVKNIDKGLIEAWKSVKNRKAHGISVSLYEKNPLSGRLSGEPLADAFVYKARHDSAFLAVADGVNWGRDSMQAARCAIYSVYEYIETQLYGQRCAVNNVKEAAQLLFETFSAAQDRIVSCTTGLTTLCVALVLPVFDLLDRPDDTQPRQFAMIVASVGDSQAYLLSKSCGIREVTGWLPTMKRNLNGTGLTVEDRLNNTTSAGVTMMRDTSRVRDFRYTGGALGPVYANGNPELDNLICAVTLCDPGDIVILGSDGLTDNFDPVIIKVAVAESPQLDFVDEAADDEGHSSSSDSINLSPESAHFIPAKSWSKSVTISPPAEISIWPRPPPPPGDSPVKLSDTPVRWKRQATPCLQSPEWISARSLNFTNQLEMTWSERRRYAEKNIERVWHETDAYVASPKGRGGIASSRDLCEALIAEVVRVTAEKRALLQDPELARLRMPPEKLKRLNIPSPDEELGGKSAMDAKRKWLNDTLKFTPGKLDHATVVAYEVGFYRGNENEDYETGSMCIRSCDLPSFGH